MAEFTAIVLVTEDLVGLLDPVFAAAASYHGVEANLLKALAMVGIDADVPARGIMQLHPDLSPDFCAGDGSGEWADAHENINEGARLLKACLDWLTANRPALTGDAQKKAAIKMFRMPPRVREMYARMDPLLFKRVEHRLNNYVQAVWSVYLTL